MRCRTIAFRLWIVATILGVLSDGVLMWAIQAKPAQWSQTELAWFVAIVTGPPILVFLLGAGIIWAFGGFEEAEY